MPTKLRVTAAEPGRVQFELDIKKEHTVSALKGWHMNVIQ